MGNRSWLSRLQRRRKIRKRHKVVKNKKPNPVKDVVPSETPETTEISETPQDSTTNTTSVKVDTTKESPKRTKRSLEDLVGSENIITTCELAEEQVVKAVSAAFKAYEVSQKKTENLNLLISSFQPSKFHKESQFSFPRNYQTLF